VIAEFEAGTVPGGCRAEAIIGEPNAAPPGHRPPPHACDHTNEDAAGESRTRLIAVGDVSRAEPPFFVVGNPRSGTKMLRELLNASPAVWISDVESNFIPRFTREIHRYGDLARFESFARLATDLEGTRAFWHWQRRGVVFDHRRWFEACPRHDWPGVLTGLFRIVYPQEMPGDPRAWDSIVWGDKTPLYMVEMPLLAGIFPRARFVHIVRDPRDCALSSAEAWGNSLLRTAQEWADRVRTCRADGARLGPERYVEIRYEDLLADVEGTTGRLFAFLGVPAPADRGRLARVPENVGAARGEARVVAENQRKWQRRMAPSMRRRFERVCGGLLDALGYEREYPDIEPWRVPALRMRAYRLRDAWRQVQFRRRELGGWVPSLGFLFTRRERI